MLDIIPIDAPMVINNGGGSVDWENNYQYPSGQVKFQNSSVCLQGNYYEDLRELPVEMIDYIFLIFEG